MVEGEIAAVVLIHAHLLLNIHRLIEKPLGFRKRFFHHRLIHTFSLTSCQQHPGSFTVIRNVEKSNSLTNFADLLCEGQSRIVIGGCCGGDIDDGDFGEAWGEVLEESRVKAGVGAGVEFDRHRDVG